jgi:hypothetical protein
VQKYFDQIKADLAANHLPSTEITKLAPVFKAYAAANNGHIPQDPSNLLPFLTTPEQQAAFHNLFPNTSSPK